MNPRPLECEPSALPLSYSPKVATAAQRHWVELMRSKSYLLNPLFKLYHHPDACQLPIACIIFLPPALFIYLDYRVLLI